MPQWFSGGLTEGVRPFGPQRSVEITYSYFPSKAERIARDRWGRFTSAQAQMGPAMERLAIRLQEMQVSALYTAMREVKGGMRDQRGTHHLEDAIMSSRNRRTSADGMVVGIEESLDESEAGSYWRGLEQGTTAHLGQRMYGLWVTPGGLEGPIEGARNAIGFVGWRGVPSDVAAEYRNDRGRLPGFRIRRSIRPYHYLTEGIQNFLASGAIQEELDRAVELATGVQRGRIERE